MHRRYVCFALALYAVAAAANASAACEVAGTIIGVKGDPAGATLYRNNRPIEIFAGRQICAGDRLSAGSGTLVRYETNGGVVRPVSGRTVGFSPHEGHAPEADIE